MEDNNTKKNKNKLKDNTFPGVNLDLDFIFLSSIVFFFSMTLTNTNTHTRTHKLTGSPTVHGLLPAGKMVMSQNAADFFFFTSPTYKLLVGNTQPH